MLCKQPFVRDHNGTLSKVGTMLSKEARLRVTPFPCGQCLHCRINRSRVWTTRILLEQMTNTDARFITLTYDEDNLPPGGNLVKSDLQAFMKRLRYYHDKDRIRYYAVGEYGSRELRPHYHLMIFSNNKIRQCKHANCLEARQHNQCPENCSVAKAWDLGHISVDPCNKDTARYITKYMTNKVNDAHRLLIEHLEPEFATMSRHNGGIGFEGIKRIAQQYRKFVSGSPQQTIRSLKFGSKEVPLGGYLSHKLSDLLDVPDDLRDRELSNYQIGLIQKHMESDGTFLKHFLDAFSAKRHSRENRQKIFSQRRQL